MAKTAQINMRVEPFQQSLLDRAASVKHVDRTTFIINAACREAEEVLLEQNLFQLDDEAFNAFQSALESPVPVNARLKSLLKEPSPWEK